MEDKILQLEFETDQVIDYESIFKQLKSKIVNLLQVKNSLAQIDLIFPHNHSELIKDKALLQQIFSKLKTCSDGFNKRLNALNSQNDVFKRLVLDDKNLKFYNFSRVFKLTNYLQNTLLH